MTPIPFDTPVSKLEEMGVQLFQSSPTYKPFYYPWAEKYEDDQQSVHWIPREIPMGSDLKDWAPQSERLTDAERNLLLNIYRLFTQSDIDVNDNYNDMFINTYRNAEIRRMLTVFNSFETIHIKAYSYILESLKLPESTYHEFLDIEEMRDKHDYLKSYRNDTLHDLCVTAICFPIFVEGLQLFASFAMLLNFTRFGRMMQTGQIVSWSIRDETIHVEAGVRLGQQLLDETGHTVHDIKDEILDACKKTIKLEDAFIDKAFEIGEVRGMTADDAKKYVRFIADYRLMQVGLEPYYGIIEHPMPWIDELTGQEHTNFFENRATEYSKAKATGTWEKAWSTLDRAVDKNREHAPHVAIQERRLQAGVADGLL